MTVRDGVQNTFADGRWGEIFHMVTNPAVFRAQTRAFHPCGRSLARFRTHSSLQSLQQPVLRHPQIAQRKQRVQLCGVLGQTAIGPERSLGRSRVSLRLGRGLRLG